LKTSPELWEKKEGERRAKKISGEAKKSWEKDSETKKQGGTKKKEKRFHVEGFHKNNLPIEKVISERGEPTKRK